MKKLGMALLLASFSLSSFANTSHVDIAGSAAKKFYDSMNVKETRIKVTSHSGFNPMISYKFFQTSNGNFNIICKKRLLTDDCRFEVNENAHPNKGEDSIEINGQTAFELYEILNIEPKFMQDQGVDPLLSMKSFVEEDLVVVCEVRMNTRYCNIHAK